MTTVAQLRHGYHVATGSTAYNGAYPTSLPAAELEIGRADIYSTFLGITSHYRGSPFLPANTTQRKMHTDVDRAAATGHDLLIGLQLALDYQPGPETTPVWRQVYATGASIRTGKYDEQLRGLFGWLLSLGVEVVVRPMWEANLGPNVSPYYPGRSACPITQVPAAGQVVTDTGLPIIQDVADYVATWEYLTTLLKGLPGGSRLKTFYCPGCNDGTAAQAAGFTIANMYPEKTLGAQFVDIVGYDSYFMGGGTNLDQTPWSILCGWGVSNKRLAYNVLMDACKGTKPVWIGETNCLERDDPSGAGVMKKADGTVVFAANKPRYYHDFLALEPPPNLEAVNWFHAPGSRATWGYDSSDAAREAFRDGLGRVGVLGVAA